MANFERIAELLDWLEPIPERVVNMAFVLHLDKWSETVAEAKSPTCRTAGCIAGWAALRFAPEEWVLTEEGGRLLPPVAEAIKPWDFAQEALDLNKAETDHMFYGHWHPYRRWDTHLDPITRAEVLTYLRKVIEIKDVMVTLSIEECTPGRREE